jgi:hypothetical protein
MRTLNYAGTDRYGIPTYGAVSMWSRAKSLVKAIAQTFVKTIADIKETFEDVGYAFN